jgi:hypothetical protein
MIEGKDRKCVRITEISNNACENSGATEAMNRRPGDHVGSHKGISRFGWHPCFYCLIGCAFLLLWRAVTPGHATVYGASEPTHTPFGILKNDHNTLAGCSRRPIDA